MLKTCSNGKTYKKIVWKSSDLVDFTNNKKQSLIGYVWATPQGLFTKSRIYTIVTDVENLRDTRYQGRFARCLTGISSCFILRTIIKTTRTCRFHWDLGEFQSRKKIRCKQIRRRSSALSTVLGPSCAKSSSHHATGCWVANIEQGYYKWNVSRSKRLGLFFWYPNKENLLR